MSPAGSPGPAMGLLWPQRKQHTLNDMHPEASATPASLGGGDRELVWEREGALLPQWPVAQRKPS